MRTVPILLAALISWTAVPAAAQKPDVKGATVVASEPGKATAVRVAHVAGRVMAVDKATRTVTLKGTKGNVLDVVAGDEVKNFDQIKVGDSVMVNYMLALSLELQKTKTGTKVISEKGATATAKPGERPAAAAAREVTAIARVTGVNKKAKTITLKGPRGNVVTLDVQNPDQFKVVKVGDEVLVNYREALAVSVESAKK